MIGVIENCILRPYDGSAPRSNALSQVCDGEQGSAATLVESTLSTLAPHSPGRLGGLEVGYTLPVPLLQLTKQTPGGWDVDADLAGRFARTIRDNQRPLILYLFSSHFSTGAPIEKTLASDPENIASTPKGYLSTGSYYGEPVYHWSTASTQNSITYWRTQTISVLLDQICQLPPKDREKIRGITLLGETHHYFPNFETGMGFDLPYLVTDYGQRSVAGFQSFLARKFISIDALNRSVGAEYLSFSDINPPAKDIRSEELNTFTEHIDSFAHGVLPLSGWVYAPASHRNDSSSPRIHIYLNGKFWGKTTVNKRRQDVLEAHPEMAHADTGWRMDMDFRRLPHGIHKLDIFLETEAEKFVRLGSRRIVLMDRSQATPREQSMTELPPHQATSSFPFHLDQPRDLYSYYYNPLVPLWLEFREKQVKDYIDFFGRLLAESCLSHVPRYTHQIFPYANPSWDSNKFSVGLSLKAGESTLPGVSLYGDTTYGNSYLSWHQRSPRQPYGITEFHPLKPLDAQTMENVIEAHRRSGARFLSFFLEPRWQGAATPRNHNIFSFDPDNPKFGSDVLYHSLQKVISQQKADGSNPELRGGINQKSLPKRRGSPRYP